MWKKKVQWYISDEEIAYLSDRWIDCSWGSVFNEIVRKYSFFDDCVQWVNSRLDRMWEWIKQGTQKSSSSSSDTPIASSTWWLQEQRTIRELLDERGIACSDRFLSWYMTYVNPGTWKLNKAYYVVANDYEVCKSEYEKVGYVYDRSWQKWEMSWEEVVKDKWWELFDEMYDSLQEFK